MNIVSLIEGFEAKDKDSALHHYSLLFKRFHPEIAPEEIIKEFFTALKEEKKLKHELPFVRRAYLIARTRLQAIIYNDHGYTTKHWSPDETV